MEYQNSVISIEAVFIESEEIKNSIVINEINYYSSDNYITKDWISRIFNNSDSSIDISNWIIKDNRNDNTFQFLSNQIIDSGGFWRFVGDSNSFKNFHPEIYNVIGNLGFGLSGDGDMVRLYDNTEKLIDSVNYGVERTWPIFT